MKISVLTPTFQSGPYLERAIKSVLIQNDDDFEHIIVDGGSSDETLEILKRYPHLKWISEPDQGQSDAMNKAFAMSTGDWIVYLNADDWFEPGVFLHVRSIIAKHQAAEMVIGNLYIREPEPDQVKLIVPVKNYRHCLRYYRYRFPMNPVSYFYRRSVQTEVGPYPCELHYTMDYWFLLRAMSGRREIAESHLVFGTFFSSGDNKTSRDLPQGEGAFAIASMHVRNFDRSSWLYFWGFWFLHRYVREFPERVKSPVRGLIYHLIFRNKLSYIDYCRIGFRKTWKQYIKPNSPR